MRPAEKTTGAKSLLAIAGLGLSAAFVAGCSSSSSPSQTAATSSTSPGATSSTGASGSPGAAGTGSPSAVTPPPLAFHGVSQPAWVWAKHVVPNLAGVDHVSYTRSSRTLWVYFKPGTTGYEIRNVKAIVKQVEGYAAQGKKFVQPHHAPHPTPTRNKPKHHRPGPPPTSTERPSPFPTHRRGHGPTASPSPTPTGTSTR